MNWLYRRLGKRLVDLCVAVLAIVLLSPVLLAVAALVRWKLGAPVVYAQVRPGRGGRPFTIYKFRSMLDVRDGNGVLLPDEQRMTRFGTWLRNTSLDELPELWNVFRGDMSLVGPRPLLTQYLPLYTPQQARRHEVRPGLTGLAQVKGRNRLAWPGKFAIDVWYVDRLSLALDVSIVAQTVLKVFARDGIHAEGHATAPAFTGRSASLLPAGVDGTRANLYNSRLPLEPANKEVLRMDDNARLLQTLDTVFERTPGTTQMDEVLEETAEYSSLTFIVLIAAIDDEFGVTISPDEFLSCRTVADLAERIGVGSEPLKKSA